MTTLTGSSVNLPFHQIHNLVTNLVTKFAYYQTGSCLCVCTPYVIASIIPLTIYLVLMVEY
jgi:hypothetical protein